MKAIDLGLSVMWGDCNLGANECYENGNLYKWEDIIPKAERHSIKYDLVENYAVLVGEFQAKSI